MKLSVELAVLRRRLAVTLHLDQWKEAWEGSRDDDPNDDRERVIVYQTANGFCCIHHGKPIEFGEFSDVQFWSVEMDVRTYFMGL